MILRTMAVATLATAALTAAPLSATASRGSIAVGETTIVRLSGGRLAQIMPTPAELSTSAGALTFRRLDGARWEVKGVKPCECVVEFGDGKETVQVRIKVAKK